MSNGKRYVTKRCGSHNSKVKIKRHNGKFNLWES